MKKLAARVGDDHMCPLLEGPKHVGGPLNPPGAAMVLIHGKPAIRVLDTATCNGPADLVMKGAPMVLIGGVAMARKGDPTVHGGVIMDGDASVIIGGTNAPTTDVEAIRDAMNLVRTSEFAQTAEGQRVLARLEEIMRNGDIHFKHYDDGSRGEYDQGEILPYDESIPEQHGTISVAERYSRDPQAIASELVHEATHGVEEDRDAANTIDQEMRTNTNQLDLYEEQRKEGFGDLQLEGRRTARNNGKLRENIRSRYPDAPEH